jgi:16S rRNA (guanine527-N7)-methyltransferase
MTPQSGEDVPRGVIAELFPATRQETIYRYVDLLMTNGMHRGLLGPREAERVWGRHILNCAVLAPLLGRAVTMCDLGSGAGLPGMVLAIARPDLTVILLEPLLRRATFLSECIVSLGLQNVRVVRARAEDAVGSVRVAVVTARAVAPMERLARLALPLLLPGGELIAMKGARAEQELDQARPALAALGAGRVRLESYGQGVVDPPTRVVRIESRR